jgi:sterol desaturase/sphingolipid hydroxylase (fatty acid hydroxylase superfamily)
MPNASIVSTAAQIFLGGVIFVLLSAFIFWPLEELLEEKGALKPRFKDLAALWFYQSYGLWISAGIIYELAYLIRGQLPPQWTHLVSQQPYWLQATIALVLAEVWVYSFHRLSHKFEFLWKFHKVHHTLVDMTWSATSRQHPVDFLLIIVGANLPAMVLGIDLRSIAAFIILERFYTVLLHSNLNLDWGWFSKVIASPKLHAHHHNPKCRGNYAGILSFLDVVGRTYRSPVEKENVKIEQPDRS